MCFSEIRSARAGECLILGEMKRRSAEILQDLGVKIDVNTQVQMLSTAQMQIVEIAKAMVKNCKVLIMDEPSASIPMAEVRNMFRIVRRLKERGVSVIYISHRLEELFELCDRVTVFRDGKFVVTRNVADITKKDLIRYMIGRELTEKFPERKVKIGEPVLEVRDLTGNGDFHINMTLHRGEVLGLAGLVGAGRTELAKMLCGDVKPESGEIIVKGTVMNASSVADAVDRGIGLIRSFLYFGEQFPGLPLPLRKYMSAIRPQISNFYHKFYTFAGYPVMADAVRNEEVYHETGDTVHSGYFCTGAYGAALRLCGDGRRRGFRQGVHRENFKFCK